MTKMDTFEEYIQRATASGPDRKLPGAVLIVTNKDGACVLSKIVYNKPGLCDVSYCKVDN
jgi:hypothetical protein